MHPLYATTPSKWAQETNISARVKDKRVWAWQKKKTETKRMQQPHIHTAVARVLFAQQCSRHKRMITYTHSLTLTHTHIHFISHSFDVCIQLYCIAFNSYIFYGSHFGLNDIFIPMEWLYEPLLFDACRTSIHTIWWINEILKNRAHSLTRSPPHKTMRLWFCNCTKWCGRVCLCLAF